MTLYSAFGVNGNGATGPGASTSFGPGIIQGLSFEATTTGVQLDGFYYWRADSSQSASASFQLWKITGAGAGSTVAGASASTSTAVAGQWNYVQLATPAALTSGQEYMAVVGFTGNFSDTHPYYGSGGTASAGVTNGPLRVFSDASGTGTHASNPQCAYTTGTSNPASSIPASSNTDYNCWIDVLVETNAGGPPPAEPPRFPPPQLLQPLLEEAWTRADWQAQAVTTLTVTYASSSGGQDTYNVSSQYNDNGTGSHPMRVLAPTAPNINYPHAFLIMLPVGPDQDTTNGDSIGTAQAISAHNNYNLTCVQPGYAGVGAEGPWYSDNPLNTAIYQETFTLKIVDWVKKNLATTGVEKVYLIGFSRSGLGGQGLQLHHPDIFAATASWDSPFMMTDYDGTDPTFGAMVGGNPAGSYGTSSNFTTHYQLTTARLTAAQATGQYGINRIWLGLGPTFQPDVPAYDALLTAVGIPHTYNFADTGETHAWHNDWVSAALASIIPSLYSEAPTPPQIPHPLWLKTLLPVAAERMLSGLSTPSVSGGATGAPAAITFAAPAGTVAASSTVAGVVTGITLAAPAGAAGADAAVAGVAAQVTLTAAAGSAAAGSSVTGVAAALTLAAPAGSAVAGDVVAGTTAALTLAAPAGSLSASSTVTGVAAALTLTAAAGNAVQGDVLAGPPAVISLAAPAGSVTADAAAINGATARLALAAVAGAVSSSTAVNKASSTAAVLPQATLTAAVVHQATSSPSVG